MPQEVAFWSALHGTEPHAGSTVTAYVQNVREDGKVDVALRPVGFDKVLRARERVVESLEECDTCGEPLTVGPKSSAGG